MNNRLLQNLGESERSLIVPRLTCREFSAGEVLAEQGERLTRIAFPVSALFTHEFQGPGEVCVETGWIGREGVAGPLPFLARAASPWRITTRLPGSAWCIEATELDWIVDRSPSLRERLARLALYYNAQDSLSTVCAASHSVLGRVARWVLMASNHVDAHTVFVTQDEIARLLSLQRTSVVEAFGKLREQGATRTTRGRLLILDRSSLRRAACPCCDELDRLARELDVPIGS